MTHIFTQSSRFILLSCLLIGMLATGQPSYAANPIAHQIALPAGMTWCDDTMINGLMTQVNAYRGQNGVAALAVSTLGMKDAEIRATQFAAYMAVNTPGTPGFNPHQGYDTTAASLGYNIVSENLAYLTSDPVYIVYAAWQDSLHIAAMLARDANVAGVSCVFYNGSPYWTYEPGIAAGGTPPPTGGTPTVDGDEWAFLTLINNYRAQNGAGSLQISAALQNSSTWMSNDMATNHYAGHTDSLGRSPGVRMAAFGYPYTPWAENIAGGFGDPQTALTQWINACDPDATGACTYAHRVAMLNPSYRVIGIGRIYNANSTYGWYWTTDFGGVVDQTISPTTPPPPSAPNISSFTANPSTVAAGQSATLSWTVSGATTMSIDNGVGDVSNTTSKAVSPSVNTTYKLTAANNTGSVTATTTIAVTSAPPVDNQPPTAPVLTSAVAANQTQVNLAWTASTDNVGVTGYQVLRSGSLLASVSAAVLTYSDLGAVAGATYQYSVQARDAAGNLSAPSNSIQVTTPAPPVTATCPLPATGAFTGCYYNNINLSGTPSLVRTDSQINFDWWYASPAASVTVRNFSVRWQGNFFFEQGTYVFSAMTSDGMRIYIDGNPILDRWRDQAVFSYTIRPTISQGNHLITVEYYEISGTASAHLTWQNNSPPVAQPPVISSFAATPSTITAGQSATLSWSVSGATSLSIDGGVGDVSSLTSKSVSPTQTTTYKLTASNSGGTTTASVTLAVTPSPTPDNQPPTIPVLRSATAQSATRVDLVWTASSDNVGVTGYQILRNGSPLQSVGGSVLTYSDTATAANTTYTYSVKGFDAAGNYSAPSNSLPATTPAAPVASTCSPGAGVFIGCYYNNTDMTGTPVLIRTDNQINFDWWYVPPASSVSADNFSVRWQGNFFFAQGTYTFSALTSDGMRIYIDGNLILDRWRDQSVYMYTVRPTLTQGNHLVTVEYYERTRTATAHLSWQLN